MSLTQNQTKFIGGTQLIINALGASVFPYKFQTGNGAAGGMIQLVTGATTFIVPNAVSGASIGGATALGAGNIGAANVMAGGLQGIGNAATLASMLRPQTPAAQPFNYTPPTQFQPDYSTPTGGFKLAPA